MSACFSKCFSTAIRHACGTILLLNVDVHLQLSAAFCLTRSLMIPAAVHAVSEVINWHHCLPCISIVMAQTQS